MPIYEYRCEACGHEFELMQKITERPVRKCEACGRLKAKRMISQTSFILRGSGWYVTDYKGKKPSDSGHNGHKSKDSSPSDSGSEKPATPPATTTKDSAKESKAANA